MIIFYKRLSVSVAISFCNKHIELLLPLAIAIPNIRLFFARRDISYSVHFRTKKRTFSSNLIFIMQTPSSALQSSPSSFHRQVRLSSYNIFIINWKKCNHYFFNSFENFAFHLKTIYQLNYIHQQSNFTNSYAVGRWTGFELRQRFTILKWNVLN